MADLPSKNATTLDPNSLTPGDNLTPNSLAGNLPSPYVIDDSFDFFSTQAYSLFTGNFLKLLPYRFCVAEIKQGKESAQPTYNYVGSVPLIFTLPIAPQNISIQMPFAARPTALADGILIESNGAPFRNITIAGTTGLLPFKSSQFVSGGQGTLSTVSTALNQGSQIASSAKSISNAFKPGSNSLTGDPVFDNNGYAQFHKLFKFLEYWAFLSKKPENRNLRLVFQMQKDNLNYLVTPMSFGWQKEANSGLENKYSIQLVAWKQIKEINSNSNAKPPSALAAALNYNALARISSVITNVRKIISSVSDVVRAVRSDIDSVLDVVRQVSLAVKQAINAVTTLIDMPKSIIISAADTLGQSESAVLGAVSNLQASWTSLGKLSPAKLFSDELKKYQPSKSSNNQNLPIVSSGNISQQASSSGGVPEGSIPTPGSNIASKNANPGNNQNNNPFLNKASILHNLLVDVNKNFDFLNSININSLSGLPSAISQQIKQEINYVKKFRRKDFEDVRIQINQLSRDLATAWGGGSDSYDKAAKYIGGKTPIANRKISRSEIDILNSLRALAQSLDELIAQEAFGNPKTSIDNRFNYVGKLATSFNIPFSPAKGKMAVPVPFGMDMQQIAAFYLGNPDLDNEIITLNALLPPFIDESGATFNLLTNATKNQINISDASNLYLGQKIILGSGTVPPSSRKVINITKNAVNNWVVTVDGDALDNLKTSNGAYATYYKPNTVNSSNLIFIPSNKYPVDNYPDRLKPIAFLPDVDNLQKVSRIDFLLDLNGDVVINNQGQIGLAGGLTNIVQALRIKSLTPRNSLFRHPEFGFGVEIGSSVANVDLATLKNRITESILSDSRFGDVVGLQVDFNSTTLKVSGGVTIASHNNLLPFDISLN